jgi:hypothetical protein
VARLQLTVKMEIHTAICTLMGRRRPVGSSQDGALVAATRLFNVKLVVKFDTEGGGRGAVFENPVYPG